jgi:hypothetical protein
MINLPFPFKETLHFEIFTPIQKYVDVYKPGAFNEIKQKKKKIQDLRNKLDFNILEK